MISRYFSAANTPQGFINYFNDAIDVDTASQILYIKGGSGVGKSTLMRKASKIAQDRNLSVTHIHCSSDPSSLDGVVIDDKIALFDATMPHIADPPYPRAGGKIVDLSVFLDESVLSRSKNEIIEAVKGKKSHYSNLYSLLSTLKDVLIAIYKLIDVDNKSLSTLSDEIAHSQVGKSTRSLRGFLRAIDVDGILDITDGVVSNRNAIKIVSSIPIASQHFIGQISKSLDRLYITHEHYFDILSPDMVETIGTMSHIVTSSNKINSSQNIDIDNMINIKNMDTYRVLNEYIDSIIKLCSNELTLAKNHHNRLEDIYKSAMDYTQLDDYSQKLLDDLFSPCSSLH